MRQYLIVLGIFSLKMLSIGSPGVQHGGMVAEGSGPGALGWTGLLIVVLDTECGIAPILEKSASSVVQRSHLRPFGQLQVLAVGYPKI